MGLSPKSNYRYFFSFLVLTSGKFVEALGSGIGTGSIFCLSFSLSNNVQINLQNSVNGLGLRVVINQKPYLITILHSQHQKLSGQLVYLLLGQINIVKTALVKIRAFERHLEIIEPFQPFSFVFCPQLGILAISFVWTNHLHNIWQ